MVCQSVSWWTGVSAHEPDQAGEHQDERSQQPTHKGRVDEFLYHVETLERQEHARHYNGKNDESSCQGAVSQLD